MTSRAMMKSALEQWEALHQMTQAAQAVLPKGECQVIETVARRGATRTLDQLDERSRDLDLVEPGQVHEEMLEVREIRQVLRTAVGG